MSFGAFALSRAERAASVELEAGVEAEAVASLATLLTVHAVQIPTSQQSLYSTYTPQDVLSAR